MKTKTITLSLVLAGLAVLAWCAAARALPARASAPGEAASPARVTFESSYGPLLGPLEAAPKAPDAPPAISINDVTVTEGDAPGVNAVFTVSLSGAYTDTVSVAYATQDNTALAGSDYTAQSNTLTFLAGVLTQTISIPIIGDTANESTETFYVNLSSPINATILDAQGLGTINDNDAQPTVRFAAASQSGQENGAVMNASVQLSVQSGQNVSVNYSVSGTATSGVDYTIGPPSPLVIPAGSLSASIVITPTNDTVIGEADETVILSITGATNATPGSPGTHTATIVDDDLPSVTFPADQVKLESAGTVVITTTLSAPSQKTVSVPFTVNVASSATGGGVDYTISASPLTFTPSTTVANITVTLNNDSLTESSENVIVNMGTPSFATQGAKTTHTLTITDEDTAPTDITLSNTTIPESLSIDSLVGTFTTTDPDPGETHTYSFASAVGDSDRDNSMFTISGNQLRTNAPLDFETKPTLNILVRTTDIDGLPFTKAFIITVTNVNEAPTDIALSPNKLNENLPIGTEIGTFSSTDQDAGASFTYSLVSGEGSTDNASFTIDESKLKSAASFNFETKNSYSIRVRTTDNGSLWFEEPFTITIEDVNEAPTNITLSSATLPEGTPITTAIGTFSTNDPDAGSSFTYEKVDDPLSTADKDNASFKITGNTLYPEVVFDYETQNVFNILVKSTDNIGAFVTRPFTITVTNVNEAPVALGEAYSVRQGNTLAVAATEGVLKNDSDVDKNDTLIAVLDTGPKHAASGGFSLNPNGSFTYTPEPSYTGGDQFTYYAQDAGGKKSQTVKVELTVLDAESPHVEWTLPVTDNKIKEVGNEKITLQVQASDNVTVASVRFYRWDPVLNAYVDIGLDSTGPYQWELDTRVLRQYWNQIFARAYDNNGNESNRASILIYKVTPTYNTELFLPMVSKPPVTR